MSVSAGPQTQTPTARAMAVTGRLPNFIVAGVMKGGTTSLFTWLAQHPDFFPSRVKETTFFRPFYENEVGVDPETLSLDAYRRFFEEAGDQRFVFESTPGYINGGGRLARHLDAHLPDLRVAFVLREPVDRARSYFEFQQGLLNLPKNQRFADYVTECLAREREAGGRPDWPHRGLWGGRYADLLREWSDVFGPRMRVLFFEELKRDGRAFTEGLLAWLGARGLDACPIAFSVENRTYLPKNALLHRIAMLANDRFEPFLRRNRGLKTAARSLYYRFNGEAKKARGDDGVAQARAYFAESNVALLRLLRERQPDVAPPGWLADAAPGQDGAAAALMRAGDSAAGPASA